MGGRASVGLVVATLALSVLPETITLACDKKGHDCRVETGNASISDLPFRVADERGFFVGQKTHPDIAFAREHERLTSLISGEALVALVSPLELPSLVTKDKQLRIIAVLQVKPGTFFATRGPADLRAFKGDAIGVSGQQTADAAYAMLALSRYQLRDNKDYKMVFIQGSDTRLIALENRAVSAAILDPSAAVAAQKKGLEVFPMLNYVPSLANTILIGRRDQLEQEANGVKGMLAALRTAVQRIQSAEYREEIIGMIQRHYRISEKQSAEFIYETLITRSIYSIDLRLTPALQKTTDEWLARVHVSRHWELFDSRYLPVATAPFGNLLAQTQ